MAVSYFFNRIKPMCVVGCTALLLTFCGGGGGKSDMSQGGSSSLEHQLTAVNDAAEDYISGALSLGQSLTSLYQIIEEEDVDGWNDYWNDQFPDQIQTLLADVEDFYQKELSLESSVTTVDSKSAEMVALMVGGVVLSFVAWIKSVNDNANDNITVPSDQIYAQVYQIMKDQGKSDEEARVVASAWALKGTFDVKNGLGILGTIRDSGKDGLTAITETGISESVAPVEIGDALIRTLGTSGDEIFTLMRSSSQCPAPSRKLTQSNKKSADAPQQVYIGRTEDGYLRDIPEGDWDMLFFSNGHARVGLSCVNIVSDQTTEISIKMIPVDEAAPEDISGDTDDPQDNSSDGDFSVVYCSNFDGSSSSTMAQSDIKVSGSSTYPSISWSQSGVVQIQVIDYKGGTLLYGIGASENEETEEIIPLISPIQYGDYSLSNTFRLSSYPNTSTALESGVYYSISMSTDQAYAQLVFTVLSERKQ